MKDVSLCRCCKKGCLETLISIPAIIKGLEEIRGPLSLGQGEDLKSFAASVHVPGVTQVLRETGSYPGQIIPSIIHFFDPERIIIDSPLDQVQEFRQAVLEPAARGTLKHSFEQVSPIPV
jgi:predicted NBD/HSP70 family sugar kinase